MSELTAAELRALVQGSDAWFQAKVGYASASSFSDIMAKGGGVSRKKYLRRIVAERLTGKPSESFSNAHTDRGIEQEPYARMALEALRGYVAEECGIIRHPKLMVSISPDGLIDLDGGMQIKSVIPTVQIETIEAGGYPSEHKAQIQGELWVSGRQYWDFCSFSPDMPEHLRVYAFRVERDEAYIATLAAEIKSFLDEADAWVKKLNERKAA
jgi:hypothetical protein